jgi:hydroxyacylglutathione hydrolase
VKKKKKEKKNTEHTERRTEHTEKIWKRNSSNQTSDPAKPGIFSENHMVPSFHIFSVCSVLLSVCSVFFFSFFFFFSGSKVITMIVETFPVGKLQCNCTILGSEQTGEAIIIDPGDDIPFILSRLEHHGLKAKYAIATHGHIDHVGGFHELKQASSAPVYIHASDVFLYEALEMQAHMIGVTTPEATAIDGHLNDGDEIGTGEVKLRVVHTPGHTPGSICFHSDDDSEPCLFAGDTLFMGSIGRTDLWGGSYEQIMDSLRGRLVTLPDETVVIPGHGPATSIGREKRFNPFLQRL